MAPVRRTPPGNLGKSVARLHSLADSEVSPFAQVLRDPLHRFRATKRPREARQQSGAGRICTDILSRLLLQASVPGEDPVLFQRDALLAHTPTWRSACHCPGSAASKGAGDSLVRSQQGDAAARHKRSRNGIPQAAGLPTTVYSLHGTSSRQTDWPGRNWSRACFRRPTSALRARCSGSDSAPPHPGILPAA